MHCSEAIHSWLAMAPARERTPHNNELLRPPEDMMPAQRIEIKRQVRCEGFRRRKVGGIGGSGGYKVFNCFISRAFLNEDMAYFTLLSLKISEISSLLWRCKVICQSVLIKHDSHWDTPWDSLCLSEPEVLRWPWEGRRKQKEGMDLDSFFSKCSNQHFFVVYWCKRLVCFHITVYFYPLFDATEQSYFLRVLVPHIQLKNIPLHQTKNFNYTVILRTLTDRSKNQ